MFSSKVAVLLLSAIQKSLLTLRTVERSSLRGDISPRSKTLTSSATCLLQTVINKHFYAKI